jgi:hypothetical protein
VAAFFKPPFAFYPFGAVGLFYLVRFAFVTEQYWRVIGYRRGYFNLFGFGPKAG